MRHIVTDAVVWSVGHDRAPCKNCWTDQPVVWIVGSGVPTEPCVPNTPMGRGSFEQGKWRPIVKYRDHLPCAAAMRSFVKFLWPLVVHCYHYLHGFYAHFSIKWLLFYDKQVTARGNTNITFREVWTRGFWDTWAERGRERERERERDQQTRRRE